MLAKKFRLSAKNLFLRNFFLLVKRGAGHYFIIKERNNYLPISRFAVIISSKIIKRSTARNLLKRLILNSIKLNKIYLRPGKDIIIIVRSPIVNPNKSVIEKELSAINTLYE